MISEADVETLRESSDITEVLTRCYQNDALFGKVFFPERFGRPFDPIHSEIFEVLNSPSQKKALAAPRGIGKTSIASFLRPAKKAVYAEANFIVIISATASSAIEQTENLKKLLERSPMVEKMFGDIKTKQWSKERWVMRIPGDPPHDVCIMPRGAGQQIRGKLFENSRPDYICGDDIEDPEKVLSPDQREKLRTWWFSDVMGAVDKPSPSWEVLFIGTVLHEDALLVHLLDSPQWESKKLRLWEEGFSSNAPSWMSDEDCRELFSQYEQDGAEDEAAREYLNQAISTARKKFSEEDFQYYNDELTEQELNANQLIDSFIIIDPSKSSTGGAEDAIIGVSVDLRENSIYYRRVKHGQMRVDEMINNAIVTAQDINATMIAIEDTGLKEFATFPLRNEINRRNLPYQVIELTARRGEKQSGKEERVGQMESFYNNDLVWHNKNECEELERQLLQFPRPDKWDVMDAAGYVPQVLEKGERYMVPLDIDEFNETRSDVEAEYRQLEDSNLYEQPIENWRAL